MGDRQTAGWFFVISVHAARMKLKSRAAEKAASRMEDRRRLENGESPEAIQRENSIFPPGYFENGRFFNLSSVVGK